MKNKPIKKPLFASGLNKGQETPYRFPARLESQVRHQGAKSRCKKKGR